MRALRRGLFVIGWVIFSGVGAAFGQQATPIKIGFMMPYKGVYAALGEAFDRGFQAAIAEVGGQIGGRPIQIIRADDEMNTSVAVQKYNKLVGYDKVDLVAGVFASTVAISLIERAEREKKPTIVAQAISDEVTGKFCSPYLARTSYPVNTYQYAGGQFWAKKGIKTAVLMGADYSAGRASLAAFRLGFEQAGGTILKEIWTPFQKTNDWSSALAQAQSSGAEMIYAAYAGSEAVQVVRQHAEFGLRETMPLVADQFVYDPSIWPALGDNIYGATLIAEYNPNSNTDANKKFIEVYRSKFGETPDGNASLGYDNGKAIMLTLEKFGGQLPRDGAEFVSEMRKLDYQAPRGRIQFNKRNSALLEKVYVLRIIKGEDGKPRFESVDEIKAGDELPATCEKL
jgi:branched-chain amino acid transport system substrate-binding protein